MMNRKDEVLFTAFLNQRGLEIDGTEIYFKESRYRAKKITLIDHEGKKCIAYGKPVLNQSIADFLKELTGNEYKLVFRTDDPINRPLSNWRF